MALVIRRAQVTFGVAAVLWAALAFAADTPAAKPPMKIASERLPNSYRVTDKVISGGLPEGDEAFRELRDLGVKTIISVDGAKPDLTTAKKYGLRYVHLPHSYDGIPDARVTELAKAITDLPGPIYIHCHHGKHRSPAAAASACVAAGMLDTKAALRVLKTAGTSPDYAGLYQTVASARPLAKSELRNMKVDFRETVDVPPMADAMVEIEHIHDHLTMVSTAEWKAPAKHPDISLPHEALLLREQFTELLRTEAVKAQPEKFQGMLRDSEQAAVQMEQGLRKTPVDQTQVAAAFVTLTRNCKACHQAFRDVPLSVKQTSLNKNR